MKHRISMISEKITWNSKIVEDGKILVLLVKKERRQQETEPKRESTSSIENSVAVWEHPASIWEHLGPTTEG